MDKRPEIPSQVKLLLGALGFGAFAFSLLATVIGVQVFEMTGSKRDLGWLGLAQFLPILVLSPFTGTIADRFDRRWVYACGLTIMTVATVGLLAYASTNPTRVYPFLLLLALNGVGRAVGTPASRSLPIDLAPESSLERIVATRSLVFQIALILGPLASGFANEVSTTLPYLVIGIAQIVAIGLLTQVGKPSTAKLATAPGPRQSIRDAVEGLRFIRRSPIVLGAISLDLFAVLFGGAVALLPAIVDERLGLENVNQGVSILRASIAAAAALMALLLSLRPVTRRAGQLLFTVIAIFGVATIVLGLTRSFAVALFAVAALSAADQVSVFIRATVVPLATPEEMRGRVLAVENVFIGGSNELGAWESGETAALFGLASAVVLGGVGTLVVVGVGWFVFPELRKLDRFADVKPRLTT